MWRIRRSMPVTAPAPASTSAIARRPRDSATSCAQVADHQVARPRDRARVRLLVAGDDLQQRRLAGPVGADHRDPAAGATCRSTPSNRCCAPWLLATPVRVTRLIGQSSLGRRGGAGQAGAGGVEPQPGGHAGHAGRVPRLLDGVGADRGVADGQHAGPGAGEAGAGGAALVGDLDQLGCAGQAAAGGYGWCRRSRIASRSMPASEVRTAVASSALRPACRAASRAARSPAARRASRCVRLSWPAMNRTGIHASGTRKRRSDQPVAVLARHRQREAAVQGRRHVVGVALEAPPPAPAASSGDGALVRRWRRAAARPRWPPPSCPARAPPGSCCSPPAARRRCPSGRPWAARMPLAEGTDDQVLVRVGVRIGDRPRRGR